MNLRKSKTLFGAANLILTELGESHIQNNLGLVESFKRIFDSIDSKLHHDTKTFFLILDEVDVLFDDKRGNASDFLYKIVEFSQELKTKGKMLSIITISNNLLQNFNLDDRLRSRIGTNEIFFSPYSYEDTVDILKHIAKMAFSVNMKSEIIESCASLSFSQHGDMRRAIDLLRKSADIASAKSETISAKHVDQANRQLSLDTTSQFLKSASEQTKLLCNLIGFLSYVTEIPWHSSSSIYRMYETQSGQTGKTPLSYRRISEILREIEQSGMIKSDTRSNGRYGYGTKFRLEISPETIGRLNPVLFKKWKEYRGKYYEFKNNPDLKYPRDDRMKFDRYEAEKLWRKLFGWD